MSYLLAIDIGNTNTVIGVMKELDVLASWRVTTGNLQTEDELGILLIYFLEHGGFQLSDIQMVGICSVVPDVTTIYERISQRYFKQTAFVVGHQLDLGFEIFYKNPSAVGADRLANVVAAYHLFSGPGIVIDFGTATTFDVYDEKGNYLGGVIAPGIETSAMTLHRRAAKLPRIEFTVPDKIIATDTVGSMQNGIIIGTIEAMEGLIRRITAELTSDPKLTLTGGLGPLVMQHSALKFHYEPDLVLKGLYLIMKRLKKSSSVG